MFEYEVVSNGQRRQYLDGPGFFTPWEIWNPQPSWNRTRQLGRIYYLTTIAVYEWYECTRLPSVVLRTFFVILKIVILKSL